MKKILLAMMLSASFLFGASDDATTINATMELMRKGMSNIEDGFYYNNKQQVIDGIEIVDSANKIFGKIDVKSFMNQNNVSVQVVNNISGHITKNLKEMKKHFLQKNYSEMSKEYGELVNNCISCHIVIRKW